TGRDTVYQAEPVTIIATHARERITPVTFTNLKQSEIKLQYSAQDVPVLLAGLPSITFYSENGNGTGGYSYISLRGFDQQRLSVLVNGVPQNDPEDFSVYWIDFPDLLGSTTNIQVQRGAGSAFYGPPAIGGSINLLAVPFQPQPGVTLESSLGFQEYGSTNAIVLSTRKYSATFNSGLVGDRYMFYGRLGKLSTDGYRDKSWDDINSYFFGVERFDESLTTRIHFYGGPFSDGLVYNGLPKFYNKDLKLRRSNFNYFELNNTQDSVTYASSRRPQESEQFSQPHFEFLQEWRLSPGVTLNNTIFYIQGDGYYDYDGSGLDSSSLHLGSTHGIPLSANPSNILVRAFVGNKQWGWLPRLEFNHGSGTLTVGAELRFHRSLHWGKIAYAENLPAMYDPDYHIYEYQGGKDILSVYGHELTKMNDAFTLMTDLQMVYNRYSLSNEKFNNNHFSYPYLFLNPRIGLNYNINEAVNTYISLAYTSREPRLKDLYKAEESIWGSTPIFSADTAGGMITYDFKKPLAKPEHLFDVELGGVYHSGSTTASVNLFWMEFSDELIKSGTVDIFGEPVMGNADRSRHMGVELQVQTDLLSGISLSGNATISYNRLIRYSIVEGMNNGSITRQSLDGNPIAGSPDIMGNVRLFYDLNDLRASITGKYVGAFYTDNTKNALLKNDAYAVVDAMASYRFALGSGVFLTVRGEARNILNSLFTMSGEGQEFFPAAERNYIFGTSLQF
ncbi:MAG: TonB-dependent receptor, partial [Ignavibacteriae bacterium]